MMFGNSQPIIGMVHLDYLPKNPKSKGMTHLLNAALKDVKALEAGGVNAILIENWRNDSTSPYVSMSDYTAMVEIVKALMKETSLPLGVNVLPNDYRSAFAIAKECGLPFIQVDVLSDHVETNYSYSDVEPFEIIVDKEDFLHHKIPGAQVFASIIPKHYHLLSGHTIQKSAQKAVAYGADAIVVTGTITGAPPIKQEVLAVANAVSVPVLIGSGLDIHNVEDLLPCSNGAIVGTAFKSDDFSEVVPEKVLALMNEMKKVKSENIAPF